MFVCPHCRIEYEEDKKFCKKCGEALGFRAAKKNCPDCLIEYEPDKKFCKKCGRILNPGPLPSAGAGVAATDRPFPPGAGEQDVGGAGPYATQRGFPSSDHPAGRPRDDREIAADTAGIHLPGKGTISPAPDRSRRRTPDSASSAPKARPWYAVLVPIMMGLYAAGLLVASIMVFTVDGMLYFYDDEVRAGWAMLIGCIASVVTGIVLWRRKPGAGVFVVAAILLLGLVPFLIALFSFLSNLP